MERLQLPASSSCARHDDAFRVVANRTRGARTDTGYLTLRDAEGGDRVTCFLRPTELRALAFKLSMIADDIEGGPALADGTADPLFPRPDSNPWDRPIG